MIGEKIKELRKAKSMTQKDLADQLFVTPQAVSRWENGDVEPSVSIITEMAKIFNVSVNVIFGMEPDVRVEKEYVVKEAPRPVLGVCERCNKPIYDAKQLIREGSGGRNPHSYIICADCKRKREEAILRDLKIKSVRRRIMSYILGSIVAALILAIGIPFCVSNGRYELLSAVIPGAFAAFTFISCCLFENNFIGDLTLGIWSWGFVKLPGLIFSLDLEGIIWLLTVKLCFWILGFLLAACTGVLAILVSGVLSLFVYPFALYRNLKHPEKTEN